MTFIDLYFPYIVGAAVVVCIASLAILVYKNVILSNKERELINTLIVSQAQLRSALKEEKEKKVATPTPHPDPQPASKAPSPGSENSFDSIDNTEYLKSMITNIGCTPEVDSEDQSLSFRYQGEKFFFEYNGVYLRIWDPGWLNVSFNHPHFRDIIKVINETNFGFGPTVVFTNPDTSGSISIHSRTDIYFPKFADNDPDYLKHILNLFFETKNNFASKMKQINEEGTNLPDPTVFNLLIPSDN